MRLPGSNSIRSRDMAAITSRRKLRGLCLFTEIIAPSVSLSFEDAAFSHRDRLYPLAAEGDSHRRFAASDNPPYMRKMSGEWTRFVTNKDIPYLSVS